MARAARTVLFIIAALVLPTLSAAAQVSVEVQLHGAPLIGALHAQLVTVGGYDFRTDTREILVLDRVSGRRVYTITHPDHACLTFTGEILRLHAPSVAQREILFREIDRFNSSASVGTLYYDERTGELSMKHHLDPGQTGIRGMVDVARRFGAQILAEQKRVATTVGL